MRIFTIKVIAKSSKNSVEETNDPRFTLKIKVTDSPVKGKANKKVIGLLAKFFLAKKSNIAIIKGEKDSIKTIQINE